jgi:hypothetical protein
MKLTEMSWTECWFWWPCRYYVQASSLGNECCSCNKIENSHQQQHPKCKTIYLRTKQTAPNSIGWWRNPLPPAWSRVVACPTNNPSWWSCCYQAWRRGWPSTLHPDPSAAREGKQPGRGRNKAASITSEFRQIRATPWPWMGLARRGGHGCGAVLLPVEPQQRRRLLHDSPTAILVLPPFRLLHGMTRWRNPMPWASSSSRSRCA